MTITQTRERDCFSIMFGGELLTVMVESVIRRERNPSGYRSMTVEDFTVEALINKHGGNLMPYYERHRQDIDILVMDALEQSS